MTISVFWQKFKIGPFLAKNGQIWPFFAKNARFGLFLPNATINVPHFRHRNVFVGLLKMAQIFFWGGGILKIDFLGVFSPKFDHFGPNMLISAYFSNATINVPHFRHRNVFFGLLKNGANFFWGEILKIAFWVVFWPKIGQICSFWPISHKHYYKCSSFSP